MVMTLFAHILSILIAEQPRHVTLNGISLFAELNPVGLVSPLKGAASTDKGGASHCQRMNGIEGTLSVKDASDQLSLIAKCLIGNLKSQ